MTASRNAARTPPRLERPQAGGGGAPGRGHRRPQRLGPLGRLVEQPRRPEQRLGGERLAHRPGQAGEHPRLDQRLGHQEHVGRARARQPGHGVEQRPPRPARRCPPPRAPPPPRPGRPRRPRTRGRPRPPRPRPAPACWASPARPGCPGASAASSRASVTPAAIDSTGARRPDAGQRPAGALDVAGLHGQHVARGGGDLVADVEAGEPLGQLGRPAGQLLDRPDLVDGRPPAGDQAGDQRLAHLAAADHLEPGHRHAGDVTIRRAAAPAVAPTTSPIVVAPRAAAPVPEPSGGQT